MRSFADYRKSELRRDIYRLNVREGFNRHFDILRYDLLDAAKLPSVMFENVAHNVVYEKARKDDYAYTRAYFEDLIVHCKNNFFDELLEAAAVAPADSLDALKQELVDTIKSMCEELRKNIAGMLTGNPAASSAASAAASGGDPVEAPGASHLPDDDDPDELTPDDGSASSAAPPGRGSSMPSSSAAPRPTSGPTSGPSRPSSGPGHVPSSPAPAGDADDPAAASAPGSGPRYKTFGKTPWDMPTTFLHGQKDLAPPDADGSQPAPYGSFFPSKSKGGFFGGLGRLAKAYIQRPLSWLTRGVRRAWHGDEDRYMRKESTGDLGTLLLENAQSILDLITKFETDLLTYVDQQIAKIAQLVGANPALGTSSPAAKSKPAVNPSTGGGGPPVAGGDKLPVQPRDATGDAGAAATSPVAGGGDPNAAAKGAAVATGKTAMPQDNEPSAAEAQATELKDAAAALKGAEMLGIKVSGIGPKGGWGAVDQSNMDFGDGKPEASWAKIRNRIYNLAYEQLKQSEDGKQMIEAYLDQKRKTPKKDDPTKMMRGTIAMQDRVKLVCQWLNVEPKGYRTAAIQLLAAFYRKTKGIPVIGAGAKGLENNAGAAGDGVVTNNAGDGTGTVTANATGDAALSTGGAAGGDKLPVQTRDDEAAAAAVPKDAPGLLKYIQAKHPEIYAALRAEIPDEADVIGWLEKGLNKTGGNGQAVIDNVQKKLGLAGPAPAAANAEGGGPKKVPGASDVVTGPTDQARTDAAPPEQPPAQPPAGDTAAPAVNKVALFRDRLTKLQSEPEYADLKDDLDHSKLSDEELAAALGDLDPNSDDAVLAASEKIAAKAGAAPTQEPTAGPTDNQPKGDNKAGDLPPEVQAALGGLRNAETGGGATGSVEQKPEGDPVTAAKNKADQIVNGGSGAPAPAGREALNNDPRLGQAIRALRGKLDAHGLPAVEAKKRQNAILDAADAIADKDGVDAALAHIAQETEKLGAGAPAPSPDGQPPAPPSGGDLAVGDKVNPSEVAQDAKVNQMLNDLGEKLATMNSSMSTDAIDALTASIQKQYDAIKTHEGPEKALAFVQDQIAQHTTVGDGDSPPVTAAPPPAAAAKPKGKQPVAPVPAGNTGPVPILGAKPGKAKKPSARALKAEQGAKAARELQYNDQWLDLIDRLQNAINQDPDAGEVTDGEAEKFAAGVIGRVAKGSLSPEDAMTLLSQRAGEAEAKVGIAPPEEKGGKKKKKKKKVADSRTRDDVPEDFGDYDGYTGDDMGDGRERMKSFMKKESFQHILNRFRTLLAG